MSATDRVAKIHEASAEQRFIAAQIAAAAEGCKSGNAVDCDWLKRCGIEALCLICPDGTDPAMFASMLMPNGPVQMRFGGGEWP